LPVRRTIAVVERERQVRRNTILLAVAQGMVQATVPVLLIVGSVAAADLSGTDSSVGVVNATYFVALAAGAFAIGRAMDRFGRRPGLLVSYLLLAGSGIGSAIAIHHGSYVGLLLFTVPFGISSGGSVLARGAVADMYEPQHRGRAVGYLLAAGTVGAVGGPFLVGFLQDLAAGSLRMDPNVLPWLVVPVGAAGALVCVILVRPDPRDLAIRIEQADPSEGRERRPWELFSLPAFRLAVSAAAVGQMAMVAVMGVTPVHLHHHHTSGVAISSVIGFHVAGMFAFSPLIGAGLDRFGRRPGLLAGAIVSACGALVVAATTGTFMTGIGLFAIGLGWSATYLGATAVVSDATHPTERAGALGLTDLLIALTSASAGLASGYVFASAGIRVLGLGVAAVVLAVVAALFAVRGSEAAPAAELVASDLGER
jgi:MFS family permease